MYNTASVCITQLYNTAGVCVVFIKAAGVTAKGRQWSLDSSHRLQPDTAHTERYLRRLFLQRTKRHPPITIATMIETAIATTAMLAWLEVASGGGAEWVPGPLELGSTTFLLGVRREGEGGG